MFRSWRFIHEKIEYYIHINRTEMNLNNNQYFVNMHSIIHNQLSAPQFKNLIKSGFVQAKIFNETIGKINKPKEIYFKFYDLYCSVSGCEERILLICAWCQEHLCYYHLIEDLHLHLLYMFWNIILYRSLISRERNSSIVLMNVGCVCVIIFNVLFSAVKLQKKSYFKKKKYCQ